MLDKQETLNFETIKIYCELVTSDDTRYDSVSKKMFRNVKKPPNDDLVLPIIRPDLSNINNVSPIIGARVQETLNDYIENNPDISRKIMQADKQRIINIEPIGRPHTNELRIGEAFVERKNVDNVCVITKFDFDDVISICE